MAKIGNASGFRESSSPRYREWLELPQFSWMIERVGPHGVELVTGVFVISYSGRSLVHSIGCC